MIVPARAHVRPQIFTSRAEGAIYLDEAVRDRLEDSDVGLVRLVGPPGSGRSVALAHLAFVLGNEPFVRLADGVDLASLHELEQIAEDRLVIFAAEDGVHVPPQSERWRIAPWTQDALIEYLLSKHNAACASVMRRMSSHTERRKLGGIAELWCAVLDRMAADETLSDPIAALQAILAAEFHTPEQQTLAAYCCFVQLCLTRSSAEKEGVVTEEFGDSVGRKANLLRHSLVKLMFSVDYVMDILPKDRGREVLSHRMPEFLVREVALRLTKRKELLAILNSVVEEAKHPGQSMAASLLHAANVNWAPPRGADLILPGAYLSEIPWSSVQLKRLAADSANLRDADFSEATIGRLDVVKADLSGATLHGAHIDQLSAQNAILENANLTHARIKRGDFASARMRGANCEGALLASASLHGADLQQARFCRANLSGAILLGAHLAEADFTSADLSNACLSRLPLREADFGGARFSFATLDRCDMEGMILPGARMDSAVLTGAYLTATRMPEACLWHAKFSHAALADIEWERADLRGADLRGCTFHMGSSRSGLVGSPIASEGSRTGFYTDELEEQSFKAPEEIRKANLRGADLRGALIDNVDFYLVDLRDARYTPDQEEQFRRTGAILESRV